jgi:hypothetical protein
MGRALRVVPGSSGKDSTVGTCSVKDVASYLSVIKARIIAHPQVTQLFVVREEAQGNVGLLRYRLTLRDGGLLELFERFQVQEEKRQVKATNTAIGRMPKGIYVNDGTMSLIIRTRDLSPPYS